MDNSFYPQLFPILTTSVCGHRFNPISVMPMSPLQKLLGPSTKPKKQNSHNRPAHLRNQQREDAWRRIADIASILAKLDSELADLADDLAQSRSKHLDHRSTIARALEYLAEAVSARRSSEISLAWCAERSEVGRLVGTTTSRGFYTKQLGYSTSHANTMRTRAKTAYGHIHIAEYDPDDDVADEETSNQRSKRMRRAKNKLCQEQHAQSEARRLTRKISTDKVDAIDRELRHLNDTAVPGKHRVRLESMQEALNGRDCADLSQWCRERIRNANNHPDAHSSPAKKRASRASARSKRYISQPRELPNGMINFGITTDSAYSARFDAIRAKATRVWKARQADATITETRTQSQFIHDYFMDTIFGPTPNLAEAHATASSRIPVRASSSEPHTQPDVSTGAAVTTPRPQPSGSVSAQLVLVGTINDYLNMGPKTRFQTDTGATLTPAEIMQLGISECHLGITDNRRAQLLDAGTVRNMSQVQRAFLTAMQLVCSHPDCSEPAANCEGHHIAAYAQGGKTDFENLTLLCSYHHRANNDQRDGKKNMGHMVRQEDTHLVGKYNPETGSIEINRTIAAGKAPARRLIAQDNGSVESAHSHRAA